MTDRSIIFNAPMVRALLDGTKTQTRRVLKPLSKNRPSLFDGSWSDQYVLDDGNAIWRAHDIAFSVGDHLWVREAYYQRGHWEPIQGQQTKGGAQKWGFVPADNVITFDEPADCRAGRQHSDPATVTWHKRLGRFMPRKYSRLTLTVTVIRVERLQDISEEDAFSEGIESDIWDMAIVARDYSQPDARFIGWPDAAVAPSTSVEAERVGRESFRTLWDSINGPDAWDANPWVVVVSFEVHQGNIDQMPSQQEAA